MNTLNITVESGGTLNLTCNSQEPLQDLELTTLTVKQIIVTSEDSSFRHIIQSNNALTADRYITLDDTSGTIPQGT